MDFEAVVAEMQAEWQRELEQRASTAGLSVEELERLEAERRRSEDRAKERETFLHRFEGLEPPEVLGAIFDYTMKRTIAVQAVDRWLSARKPALLLFGSRGTGKTVASLYALRRMGRGALVRAHELAERIAPTAEERRYGVRQVSLSSELIAIEDVGTERSDDRSRAALFLVVDSRQTPRRRTIITTNLTRAQFIERCDDRVIDRLRHTAAAVDLGGESLRSNGAGL